MGTTANNSIEINGKLYDARTGQLAEGHSSAVPHKKTKAAVPKHSGRSIDGITHAVNKPSTASKKPRSTAPHAPAHKTQRPQTLMRSSVLKPHKPPRSSMLKVQVPVARHPHATSAVQPKLSVSQIHPARAHAAAHTPKSPAVSKYSKPLDFTQPKTQQLQNSAPQAIAAHKPSEKTQAPHAAYFQKAIEQANNHASIDKSPKRSPGNKINTLFKRHRSVFGVAASITLVVAIGGFVAFANMSKLELEVANMRAGIEASLPTYEPAGYTKDGPVSYQAGSVTISFKNTTANSQKYSVSQQESDLNSSTLQDEVLAGGTKPRQIVQQNGNTIYLYGDSDAAWVSGGILYKITGDANLSTNEILLIADSV
jgi:hypothetical protein